MTKTVKKTTMVLALFACLICLSLGLVACGSHEHAYGEEWKSNAVEHWHECSPVGGGYECTSRSNVEAHSFGDVVVTTAATCMADGSGTRKCTVCNYEETVVIPKTAHKFTETTKLMVSAEGHSYICANAGCNAVQELTAHVADTPVVTAATDYTAGKSETHCSVCGYLMESEELAPLAVPVSFDVSFIPTGTEFAQKASVPTITPASGDEAFDSINLYSNGDINASYQLKIVNAINAYDDEIDSDKFLLTPDVGDIRSHGSIAENITLKGSGIKVYKYNPVNEERSEFVWTGTGIEFNNMLADDYMTTIGISLIPNTYVGTEYIEVVFEHYNEYGDVLISEVARDILKINFTRYVEPVPEPTSVNITAISLVNEEYYNYSEDEWSTPVQTGLDRGMVTATVSVFDEGDWDNPMTGRYYLEYSGSDAQGEVDIKDTNMYAVWVKEDGSTVEINDSSSEVIHYEQADLWRPNPMVIYFDEAGTYTIRFEWRASADGEAKAFVEVRFTVE